MTIIVGAVSGSQVVVSGDTASVRDRHSITGRATKVFVGQRRIVYGCTTSFRMIDLLRFTFDPGKVPPASVLRKWMVTTFIAKLRDCFREHGFWMQDKETGEVYGGEFICAVGGRLFMVGKDYATFEISDSAAIGSGTDFALGALHAMRDAPPQHRVLAALQAANHHCTTVCGPYSGFTVGADGKPEQM